MREKVCGIYCVQNNINGKRYIGLSKDCYKRWSDHYAKSLWSTNPDDLNKPLYKAMKLYGRDNFTFSIIEQCSEEQLAEREIYWIAYYDSYNKGYNATHGGDQPSENSVLKGEDHGGAILTEKEVIQCRLWYKEGKRALDIYRQYFSTRMTISGFQNMWRGRTWKHVMPEVFENNPHKKQKLTEDIVRNMKKLFLEGKTCAEVYHYYNEEYSRTTINDIYHERRYKHVTVGDVSTISESGE